MEGIRKCPIWRATPSHQKNPPPRSSALTGGGMPQIAWRWGQYFGSVDSGGNVIRPRIRITDQARLSVRLVHRRKARDTDEVAKNQQCHVHHKNNAEATMCPFQQFLLAEIISLWCQGGRMWASGNGGVNCVQRPSRVYSSRSAQLCKYFEQRRRRVICGG